MDLTCPKCQASMRNYERAGVTVDQCTECRGIFLDRGELDRLIDAENAWHGSPTPQQAPIPAHAPAPTTVYVERGRDDYRGDGYRGDGYRDGYRGDDYRYGKKKKKSFLDNLFD